MMELDFTNEELQNLEVYMDVKYQAINQLLVSNSETDIALLSDEVENEVVKIPYDRTAVIENLMSTKLLYKLFIKNFCKIKHENRKFFRGTNLAEIERLKAEPFIDRIWSATTDEKMEEEYASKWNRPVGITITLEENVPFIDVGKILNSDKYKNCILISPFTRVKSIEEDRTINLEESKYFKCYNIVLEKQNLDKLNVMERNGLYNYILENSYSIKRKLEECIKLERENSINFDNIRKMEQLLRVYENAIDENELDSEYSDIDRTANYNDVERVTNELNDLKRISTNVFEIRKQNIDFINNWKRNIAVYMIAECREIEEQFKDVEYELEEIEDDNESDKVNESTDTTQDTKIININEALNFKEENEKILATAVLLKEDDSDSEDAVEETTVENENKKFEIDSENDISTTDIDTTSENIENSNEEISQEETIEENETQKRVKQECKENVNTVQKLLNDINALISKQQNHAKIAGNMGSSYSALNNAFEMRKAAESLKEQVVKINEKANELCRKEYNERIELDLELISKSSIEISTLLNYLNNPKIAVRNSKITRFEEMAIIEENELKRGIAEKIREIRGEAELKKLKDDLEIIEEKGTFSRFIGLFTGKNKIDDFMIEQIEYRQRAIRKTLSKKLSLAHNYSIHELMAEITMFVNDNEDDELVQDDVLDLKALAEELRRNYIVLESKVQSIVEEKEGKNLLYDNRKMTRRETIELETNRFLNKYGYSNYNNHRDEEPKYQDTMSSEIGRIIEYINSYNIL